MAEVSKSPRAEKEEKILSFWKENEIFKKTLEKPSPKGEFVFYEGPPTANGRPGIHHLEARSFKDAIPRYKTMQGYHVARKGGWDTHGLPVELEVEKQLGIQSKKEIESYGIAKFNEECKKSVWKYVEEWTDFTNRIGFWVDLENPYRTYDTSYIEKVWSIISHVEKKDLLYKDYKVIPWCPRCGTGLSSHELGQPGAYQDDKDLSVYAKFPIRNIDSETESISNGAGKTYLLAWTTTPWTLPGNVALAVGEDIDYVKIKILNDHYILAESRLEVVQEEHEVIKKIKGKDLIGLSYEPLYPYLKNNLPESEREKLEKAYQVYAADFVTTEDGTGIVHTAVMYGQDDFVLGTEIGLPKYHLVDDTGHFKSEVTEFAGKFVKDEETAVEIIKNLAHRGLLFRKEKHTHSYPHCWRCKTPLIYYARDSWYIKMSEMRDKLVKENENINWEPDYIKEGRFGEWLREVKDWAISRERYWGTPLPVWVNKNETKRIVVDSIETLKKYTRTNRNKFIFIRHGEAESNVNNIVNCNPENIYHLTERGKEEIERAAKDLKADVIFSSPYTRTKESAEIIADNLDINKQEIIFDQRLGELNFGELDQKAYTDFLSYEEKNIKNYDAKLPGGESYNDAKKRFGEFLYDIDQKFSGKTILVVTHGIGLEVAPAIIEGANTEKSFEIINNYSPAYSEILEFDFVPLPHNQNFETDLHKPFIDEVVLIKDGEEYRRVKEVMDVWLDSGSMPFASFDDAEKQKYPADFISEAIDQTRGWFYTLHAVGVLMGKGNSFKNVICLGHLLDKDGRKMSKSLGNVVNPWEMIDKHGVDLLRLWMYSVNQPGESKNFDEKTVEELGRKTLNLLDNTYAFYELYRDKAIETNESPSTNNVLDLWILARLTDLTAETTEKMNQYKLLEPVRGIREFLDDFSTWFVRRSRDRIKNGDKDAKKTMYYVLKTLSKLIAPFAPFTAEDLYQNLRVEGDKTSVHLESWPMIAYENEDILVRMQHTREIVSQALEARAKANMKIRQPLQSLAANLQGAYTELIQDEVNVKEVKDVDINELKLDTNLTPELIEEGEVREIMRGIQDWRKEQGLRPGEIVDYEISEKQKSIFEKYKSEIEKTTGVRLV